MTELSVAGFLGGVVTTQVGDITRQHTDAIVNAANATLLGGGGVDGAIHRAGGEEVTAACATLRRTSHRAGLATGQAVVTTGGRLAARHVIHTVGPIYGRHAGAEAELLAACYRNCLALARGLGLRSIAFPAISTGAYGYPADEAARIVSQTLTDEGVASDFDAVRLVFYDARQRALFLDNHCFPH